MSDRFVVLSGCSGGGKSTLLAELGRRGHAGVAEPGRRIVQAELHSGGQVLPWVDAAAFARRAMEVSIEDRRAAAAVAGWVFFDRGLVDAASALEDATGEPALEPLRRSHRYNQTVFLTPPWPEIYVGDAERRHGLDESVAEYERLRRVYPSLGYRVVVLPKVAVEARADIVLEELQFAPN
jgi:predicted ATPase